MNRPEPAAVVPPKGAGRGRRVALATVAALLALGASAWGLALAWQALRPADPLAAATASYQRQDYAAAAEAARLHLRERPEALEALRLLARASARQGRADLAQSLYARLGPDGMLAEDYFVLADGLLQAGRYDVAGTLLSKGEELDPDHPEILDARARLMAASQGLGKAHDLAERLTGQAGWEPRGRMLLGLIRMKQGDPRGAAEAFARAFAIDPEGESSPVGPQQARLMQARAQLAAGRPAEARDNLDALVAETDLPEARWLLARARLQLGDIPGTLSALKEAGGFGSDHPEAPEPAPYAGAASCAECHRAIYDSQQSSHHSTTFAKGAGVGSLPLPEAPVPDPANPSVSHAYVPAEDGLYALETRKDGEEARALILYVFGSGDRGATLVGRDAGGDLCELRLSHYGDGSGWSLTTGHPKAVEGDDPHAYLGLPLDADAVRRCFDCHTTTTFAARTGDGPAALDRGIGCERCHGPAGNHLAAMRAAPSLGDELMIARPRLASAEAVTALCAGCHSAKGIAPRKSDPGAVRFQGTTLTWSRCYTESRGALSCTTCHDPHRDAETSPAYYESKCLACHTPDTPDRPPHPASDASRPLALTPDMPRTPCPVEPAGSCIDCHMPTRTGVIPHTSFTDHYIRAHPEAPLTD